MERFAALGDRCEVWTDELLGVRCGDVCTHLSGVCDQMDRARCMSTCGELPRATTECLGAVDECPERLDLCRASDATMQFPWM